MLQTTQIKILVAGVILITTSACNKISFERIANSCEAPNNSARFGVASGPIITEPTADTLVPGIVTVRGTCVSQIPVTLQDSKGQTTTVNCENESFTARVELSEGDGLKSLSVSQNSAQDGSAMVDRLCFMKDGTPPVVAITDGNSSQSLNTPVTTVSGICEDGLVVEISGPGLMNPVQTTCENGKFTAPIQTIPGDGVKDIVATQKDPLGNEGQDVAKYTIDTIAPQVRITSPAANTQTRNSILVGGTCETGLTVGIGEPNSSTAVFTSCPSGTFTISVPLTGADGVNPIQAFQVDTAGNIGQDSRNFIKDTQAPAVTISLPLANANLSPSSTFTGTCETGLSVNLSGSVLTAPRDVTCNNGIWTLATAISSGQGVKSLVATQTDGAGNSAQAQRSFQVDTIAPVLTFTNPAAGSFVGTTATIQGTCESGLTVQIAGTGAATASTATCANGTFVGNVMISAQDGTKQITISQTDSAGNTGSASRNFVRDSGAPVLTITTPANGSYVQNTITLTGACEAGLTVSLSGTGLANNASTTCTNNGTYSVALTISAGDGTKAVVASETDAAGNSSQASAQYVKDTTAPAIAITTPAANTQAQNGLTVGGTCEAGLGVILTGAGLSAPVSTTCSNAGAFTAPITFSNGDGPKTVTVSQTDAAGNTGSDSRNFIRNTMGPAITITSPAANSYVAQTFTLQGACQSGINVAISGAGISTNVEVACSNGAYLANLQTSAGDGAKAVTASQTDAIGNVGSVSRSFLRDSLAPVLTITTPANGTATRNSLTLVGTCEAGLTVNFTGDLAASQTVTCSNSGGYSIALTLSAGDGPKTINLSETDAAGNTATATGNYIKDTTGPILTFTSPAPNTSAQSGLTVMGTCEAGLNVSLSGTGLATPVTTACTTGGTFTTPITFSAGDGVKNVTASQTDALGNTGSVSTAFVRDNMGPAITITAPAANAYLSSTFTLQGTCQNGLNVVISGTGIAMGAEVPCAGGNYSASLQTSNGDGVKAVSASQTDAIGNVGTASRSFLRDATAPVLTITSPANGTAARATLTLVGACEAGLAVNFTGDLASSQSVTCSNSGGYSVGLTLSAGDGPKVISLSETDAAGNTATAQGNFIKDTTGPVLAFTAPAPNTTAQSGLTVVGTCEAGLNVTLGGSGISAPVTTTCTTGGMFTSPITFSNGDGTKAVTASQTDALGNTGSASTTFIKDTTGPAITITAPAANSYLASSFTLQGTCQTGINVVISGAGITTGAEVACAAGSFSASLQTSAGDGVKAVSASQTDASGNVGTASRNFLRDTQPPVLTIISPMYGTSVRNTVNLTGACEAGLNVNFTGTGLAADRSVVCPGNGTYTVALTLSPGDGIKAIHLSETDAAGNLATVDASYMNDTTGPAIAITSPAPNTTAQSGVTVGGTCESGLNVTVGGSGVATPVTTTCTNGTFTSPITFTNGDGPKTITASQTDPLGNVGSATSTFIKDTMGPAVTITSPAANSYLAATFVLTGNCQTGLDVEISGPGIATGGVVACANGSYSTTLTTSAGEGVKTVNVAQTDTSGNVGTATRNFRVDTAAPVLTITSPANGSTVKSTFVITGNCEAGLNVNFAGPGVSAASSVACSGGGSYSTTLTTSSGDGVKVVNVTQTDAAGNTAQVVGSFNKDTTGPAVLITSPAPNTEAQTGLMVGGTCEDGLNVTLSGAGVSSPVTTACQSGAFSANIVFSNGDGVKTVTASQTDAGGNTGSNSRNFVRDNTAPLLTITSPAANSYVATNFTLQGACQTGLAVNVTGAGIAAPVTVTCAGGAYSAALTVSSGDGLKTVMASQADAAGNTGSVSRNFMRDTQAPVIAITSPMANASVPISTNIAGTCETGLAVTLTGNLTSNATGACAGGTFNIPVTFSAGLGTKTVTASQTDAAGNTGVATSQFLRDSNAGVETFLADASFGKIDILFVDDNSASMDPQQASLGAKFSGFSMELQNIDWQIGITTTDCSNGTYGICGSLLQMTGTNTDILTKTVPNYQNVFNNTIRRPETAGCLNTGTCPAGNSQPLLAATTAMTKHNTDNNGFFRADSDLAIVILSDADEGQNSPAQYKKRPEELVSTFNSIWMNGKKLSVYSIIVKPGDAACLNQLTAANGGFSFYGNYVDEAVGLTNGISTSICAPDYSVTLKSIGESVRTLTNSVELANTPIAGTVNVTFNPAQNITYKVIGKKVVFDSAPSVGTQIQVSYQY